MELLTELYINKASSYPNSGQHILAQFDSDCVVVYQAFCPEIGHFAARNGYFGDGFKFSRMSWIKPSFLWMMHRSGWGTKDRQEVVLAIWLKRSAFDEILANAVPSNYTSTIYPTEAEWRSPLA
ncbi:DUF4291 domain-containing protein [Kovacikia minuta CCNUW1]|uniref:DUF4291 family protein n=1 Tax=Kovacikia minuta TaxID=2931930 RepID=UPI001CCF09E9|nr:DUF4291 family protein [Kovacikia minuta]UBF29094.1 DUF4291 domain-containing protein [Kovacikia minuta CCNUW1]